MPSTLLQICSPSHPEMECQIEGDKATALVAVNDARKIVALELDELLNWCFSK